MVDLSPGLTVEEMAASRVDFHDVEPRRLWPLVASDERLVSSVRGGEPQAFDVLYERHRAELFRYCLRLLKSSHDAEEALQLTFVKAHRALIADSRELDLRPWLYTIARNACIGILRRRRPDGLHARDPADHLERMPAPHADPALHAQQREDVRELLGNVVALPDRQRDALVMAELHGCSHADVGTALGVRTEQVKAYVHQARANLAAERDARAADCAAIRRELEAGAGKSRRGIVRRHVRGCLSCRAHAEALRTSRPSRVAALLPLPAVAALKQKLFALFAARHGPTPLSGSPLVARAAEAAGGGGVATAAKLLAGLALLGAGAKAGTAIVEDGHTTPAAAAVSGTAATPQPRSARFSIAHRNAPVAQARSPRGPRVPGGLARSGSAVKGPQAQPSGGSGGSNAKPAESGAVRTNPPSLVNKPAGSGAAPGRSGTPPGHGGSAPGNSGSAPGHSETGPGKGGTPPGHGGSAPGNSGSAPGHSETGPGKGGTPPGHGGSAPGNSGSAPGHSETGPGKGGTPPGHGGSAPGNSGSAPGHSESAPGHSESAPGHSGSAPGHSEGRSGGSEGSPGRSEGAPGPPGHSGSVPGHSSEPGRPGGEGSRRAESSPESGEPSHGKSEGANGRG